MSQNDNEKELILGNRQLISLFFVVVALCGVFFAMGYMIGRNTTKTTLASGTPAESAAPVQAVQRQQPEPPRETAPEPMPERAPATPPAEPQPTAEKPPAIADKEPKKPDAAKDDKTLKLPRAVSAAGVGVEKPESGASYLQVTALPRADAEGMVRTLRDQSFPAVLAESSKDGLYRVLVGPFHQTSDVAESKARLKTLGFANAFVQKQ